MSKFKRLIKQAEKRKMQQRLYKRTSTMTNNEISDLFSKSSNRVLYSTEWKLLREKVIEHYGCKCMRCGKVPKTTSQVNVDHIKPRKYYPELTFDFENLQVLCGRCNQNKGNKNIIDYRMLNQF